MKNGPIASEQLRLFIERIERLEEEKKGIADDIRDVYAEAKGQGFDTKTMREIIKLRKMEPHARREREALIDTYKAALGMLDGTPLGNWAIQKLASAKPEPSPVPDDPAADPCEGEEGSTEAAPVDPLGALTLEEAREMGKTAAAAGQPVTANPFPARDVRRAAWDEAWCAELGSDGMDIPDIWKPSQKPKPGDNGDDLP